MYSMYVIPFLKIQASFLNLGLRDIVRVYSTFTMLFQIWLRIEIIQYACIYFAVNPYSLSKVYYSIISLSITEKSKNKLLSCYTFHTVFTCLQ